MTLASLAIASVGGLVLVRLENEPRGPHELSAFLRIASLSYLDAMILKEDPPNLPG